MTLLLVRADRQVRHVHERLAVQVRHPARSRVNAGREARVPQRRPVVA